ncbi:MAG: TonB-dependent receptor, partial [Bacteroidetes bacterium]|nr:TonB-dependent receptor [Bacteroidota bacterium]
LNGQDLDDADHTSLRTDWFFDISDTTSLRVFGQFFEANNNGAAMKGLDMSEIPEGERLQERGW